MSIYTVKKEFKKIARFPYEICDNCMKGEYDKISIYNKNTIIWGFIIIFCFMFLKNGSENSVSKSLQNAGGFIDFTITSSSSSISEVPYLNSLQELSSGSEKIAKAFINC